MDSSPEPVYEQSAVVPVRAVNGHVEVLLITSRSGKRWIVPKGLIEPHLTASESAAEEAWEEAGVRGAVSEEPIGRYKYRKWGGRCEVEVFVMQVTEQHEVWLESHFRERQWFTVDEAVERIEESGLRKLIRRAAKQKS